MKGNFHYINTIELRISIKHQAGLDIKQGLYVCFALDHTEKRSCHKVSKSPLKSLPYMPNPVQHSQELVCLKILLLPRQDLIWLSLLTSHQLRTQFPHILPHAIVECARLLVASRTFLLDRRRVAMDKLHGQNEILIPDG